MLCVVLFFFFKQKTAYELRISDWSSDVCSSDLLPLHRRDHRRMGVAEHQSAGAADVIDVPAAAQILDPRPLAPADRKAQIPGQRIAAEAAARQDEIGRATWRERVCQDV